MNLKRDGKITWNEFISYLLVEFQKKDTSLQWKILKLPITDTPHLLKSHHRTPIHKIMYCPVVLPVQIYLHIIYLRKDLKWNLNFMYHLKAKKIQQRGDKIEDYPINKFIRTQSIKFKCSIRSLIILFGIFITEYRSLVVTLCILFIGQNCKLRER